ncbi:hypothetical protein EYY58_13070 [Acinetobacter bereziniae]|nr:hypothetical protein EYB59_15585 [Acinetobacter bereziniae]TNL57456.1 hypothetical protein EYY58_13070 [Acinetobacter bereziniae]
MCNTIHFKSIEANLLSHFYSTSVFILFLSYAIYVYSFILISSMIIMKFFILFYGLFILFSHIFPYCCV